MSNDPINIGDVPQLAAQATEALKQNTAAQQENTSAKLDNNNATAATQAVVEKSTTAHNNFIKAAQTVTATTKANTEANIDLVAGLERMFTSVLADTTAFNNFGSVAATAMSDTGAATKNLQGQLAGVTNFISKLGGDTAILGSVAKGLGTSIAGMFTGKFLDNMSQSLSAVQKLETGFSSMLQYSGNASQIFDADGSNNIEEFSDKVKSFNQQVTNLALASGMSRGASADLMKELGKIPGTIKPGDDAMAGLARQADATSKVIAATGLDEKTVLDEMSSAFFNLGANATEQLQYVAQLQQATQKSSLGFEQTKSLLDNVTKSFSEFGNETDSVVSIVNKFGPAFTSMHVGAKTAADIIRGLTDNISRMSVAQKGFLSAQTGGPGGLRGGFQIDKLLQQGKLKEVEEKMEEALKKQFGGKIVNLNEASSSDKSAAQYQRQLSFLQQGPFGQVAQNAGGAEKLLEALSKKGGSTTATVNGANQLDNTLAQGASRQSRSNTVISSMATRLDDIAAKQDIKFSDVVRGIAGSKAANGILERQAAEQSANMSSEPKSISTSLSETFSQGMLPIFEEMKDAFHKFGENKISTNINPANVNQQLPENTTAESGRISPTQVVQSAPVNSLIETAKGNVQAIESVNPLSAAAQTNSNKLTPKEERDNKSNGARPTAMNDATVHVEMKVQCTDCGKTEMHNTATAASIGVIRNYNISSVVG